MKRGSQYPVPSSNFTRSSAISGSSAIGKIYSVGLVILRDFRGKIPCLLALLATICFSKYIYIYIYKMLARKKLWLLDLWDGIARERNSQVLLLYSQRETERHRKD